MIWSHKYTIALISGVAVAGLGLGALAVSGYIKERERAVKAETVAETQAQVQKQLTGQIADLQKQMTDRDALYQQQLQSLQTKLGQATTPTQIAQLVSQLMGLKEPIQITTPLPTSQNPNPSPIAQISLEDAPQFKAYVQTCEECKLNLTKTQADLADRAKQAELAQQQIESIKAERDSWKVAAKGGTKWQRFKKAIKYLGIGAGIGAAALCGSGHCR